MAKSLEERLKVCEDMEEIKKMMHTYCYCCDAKDVKGVMSVFAQKCSADYGPFGKCNNRAQVQEFFENVYDSLPYFTHMVTNALIELDGDKGHGKWYFNVPSTHKPTNQAVWILGTYENDLVREKGQWKISKMVCIFHYVTPYDQGWVKNRMMVS